MRSGRRLRERLCDQWPFLATSAAVVLMGLFVLTTSDPRAGWVFIAFGGVCLAAAAGRALVAAVRDRRE